MKNKKGIILDILSKIADTNFQKKVWVDQEYWDPILNFGEAVNTLEDYFFFEEIQNGAINSTNLSLNEELLWFSKELMKYDEPSDPSYMLKDEKWLNICEKATYLKEALKLIDF
ncbi:hypothetical protein [Saccharicrinis aurantiacus]|uniref:hypothetical protein n=1 Tax=Saccharicrinis aurantiacus TaxID=1849719 RepID=UPI002493A3B4|nr:hypothetical protein [Saccharicrinis aurantiacus]